MAIVTTVEYTCDICDAVSTEKTPVETYKLALGKGRGRTPERHVDMHAKCVPAALKKLMAQGRTVPKPA
jgi:hypothetical protein